MKMFPLAYYSDKHDHLPLKVSIFIRTHELQSLVIHLSEVSAYSSARKRKWLKEYEEVLHQNLQTFSEYLSLEMVKTSMDTEMTTLLMEYTRYLQQFTVIMKSIFLSADRQKVPKSRKTSAKKAKIRTR